MTVLDTGSREVSSFCFHLLLEYSYATSLPVERNDTEDTLIYYLSGQIEDTEHQTNSSESI